MKSKGNLDAPRGGTEKPRGLLQAFRSPAGFTLIEIVVAFFILMIITSIAMVANQHARERARLALFYSDIRQVKLAAQRFEQDLGFYPLDAGPGVDPGLIDQYGWMGGAHSGAWEDADALGLLASWNGPYLDEWRDNPWGGVYEWDNYPPGFSYMGIQGGVVLLTLKPSGGGGSSGMPAPYYESVLQGQRVDISPWPYSIAVLMGRYPAAK